MKIIFAALIIASATAGAASAPAARTPLKCPPNTPVLFPHATDWVYVLDGKPVSEASLEQLDRKSVESVEIICAIDLHRAFGLEAKRGGVIVFTIPGPRSTLESSMQSIVSLQQAYLARHGVFARNLTDLPWNDASGLITVRLAVSDDGTSWSATGTHRYLIRASSVFPVSGKKSSADTTIE